MVQAGKPVDEQIALLRPVLAERDIIIDAGNANFRDTVRRFAELSGSGLTFIGMGVSGGEEGARHGPSIMVGGTRKSYARVESVLTAIAAKFEGEPCCAWLGEGGAGHFVKTIHNGIEYADMQMIAEVYGVLRDGLGMAPKAIGEVFAQMEQGPAQLLSDRDHGRGACRRRPADRQAGGRDHPRPRRPEGHRPLVGDRGADARHTGDRDRGGGRRARDLGDEGRAARRRESLWQRHQTASTADADALRGDLELALLAGKIAAYAQGFAVMDGASKEFGWGLPLATIAKIWRAGCIIRSQFLGTIAAAFGGSASAPNLLMVPAFTEMMKEAHPALRRVVARAAEAGLPMPALSSALAYFDGYRQGRGTSNLIQAQRDFFGAHGFERIDAEGAHHGPWGSGARH